MRRLAILPGIIVAVCRCACALNPSLDISQYGHDAWTVRSGLIKGNIYSMAQTPDGYLWLGGEFGLFRFDGVHSLSWQPPAGQNLPDKSVNTLLVSRDGTLWIGTFGGLARWSGGKLTRLPEADEYGVVSLLEDREKTVWAGLWGVVSTGAACAQCEPTGPGATRRMAPSALSYRAYTRTAQEISGPEPKRGFGGGNPAHQGDMPHRHCASAP